MLSQLHSRNTHSPNGRLCQRIMLPLLLLCLPWAARAADPGDAYPLEGEASDQKAGSVLVFNYFSSSAANPASENTELSITSLALAAETTVRLFLVDGSSGAVTSRVIPLTYAQTVTLSLAEIWPGKRGYAVAVAIHPDTGCPIRFNNLIGTAHLKLASGHRAQLPAVAISALAAVPAACGGQSATLSFDGTNYNRLPRVLALNNLPSRQDGNDTLFVLNRIGGDLSYGGAGAALAGTLFGVIYDDAATPFSFSLQQGQTAPQLAFSLTPATLLTTPGLDTLVPAGRSAWLKTYNLTNDLPYLGATLTFNPNAATQIGQFESAHNLTALTNTLAASTLTIPLAGPDITLLLAHSGTFVRGATGSYTITVFNAGTEPFDGSPHRTVVTDQLPTGMTLAGFAGAGWSCTGQGTRDVSCETAAALPAGGSLPVLNLTVNVAANAPRGDTVNYAGVSHPLDTRLNNNAAVDPTTILPLCPTLPLTPTTLADGRLGAPYAQTLTTSGGLPPYAFWFESGAYPRGLAFAEDGSITGTPLQAGVYVFTMRVQDQERCGGTQTYTLRIAAARRPVGDFNGDGLTDLTVWRGPLSTWFVRNGNQVDNFSWGSSSAPYFDVPVPGDYDGDGQADLAVFRRGEGVWYVRKTSGPIILVRAWGLGTDVPVPGDYDGDGKTDIAVWRGSEGNWYIRRSSDNQSQVVPWGSANAPFNDVPVAADYDGDGKTDFAVFRRATGQWFIVNSSNAQLRVINWGLGTDTPVPGDYDGDGQADVAVWRGNPGTWYIRRSSDGLFQARDWGTSNAPYQDVPVPGDYDGDGRTDIAIWRPLEGWWYIIKSSTGQFQVTPHGQAGDTPVTPTGVR